MTVDRNRLAALSGLIPAEVGERLAGLASEVPSRRAIVEIGSYRGKSACYLAAGAQAGAGAHVWAVDPWDTPGNVDGFGNEVRRLKFADPATRAIFDQQVASMGLAPHVTALQGFSVDVAGAWDGPTVGLLFIDGNHSVKAVRADFQAWRRHLVPGAVVAFDDYLGAGQNGGVGQAVDQLTGIDWHDRTSRLAIGVVE